MIVTGLFNSIRGNLHKKQTSALFVWNLIGLPVNLAINFFMTRYLGAEAYGNYSFVGRVFNLVYVLVNFGLYRSVGRAILVSNDEQKHREYYGAGLLIWLFTVAIAIIALFFYGVFSPNIEEKGIRLLFLFMIPFCSAPFLHNINEKVLPTSNKIKLLIVQRYGPRILLLITIAVLFFFWDSCPNKLLVCLCALFVTQLLLYGFVGLKLHPLFSNKKERLKEIWTINRTYGSKVYVGDLCSNLFTEAMPLLISLFSLTNAEVGFYSLAILLCNPMNYIPAAVMTSYYRMFSTYKEIPKRVFKVTITSSLVCLVILWIIITPFVKLFYTPVYNPVILLTIIASIGTLLRGVADFLTRYLASQGNGVALRNSSIIVGFSTLVCSLLLISKYGAMGAAITHVITAVIYVIVIFIYYRKQVRLNYSKQ